MAAIDTGQTTCKGIRVHGLNITVDRYSENGISEALNSYASMEKSAEKGTIYLLARASSVKALKVAYPNYFTNMRELIDLLQKVLS